MEEARYLRVICTASGSDRHGIPDSDLPVEHLNQYVL